MAETTEIAAAEPLADAVGQKLHPLGLLVGFVGGLPGLILPILALTFGTRKATGDSNFIYVLLAVLVISLMFRWVSWLRFRYYLGPDDIRIESGWLDRSARSIPYDRIQDISIEEKPLARIMGLATVKFDTGGGTSDDDAALSYVSIQEAGALRETIRERKLGSVDASAIAQDATPEDSARSLFAMDERRLLTFGLYSFSLIIFAILGGAAQQLDFLLPFDFWDVTAWIGMFEDQGVSIDTFDVSTRIVGAIIALLALLVLGIGSGILSTYLREYGFRLDRTPKGFRRRRGLLTKTDVAMPIGQIQAAIISTGPFRKRGGWHGLKFVSLAQDSDKETDFVAAPFAKMDEITRILSETAIKPASEDLHFEPSPVGPWLDLWLATTAIVAIIILALWLALDIFAWWLLPIPLGLAGIFWLQWRHESHAIDSEQLYARHGFWREQLDFARQINVQSVSVSQGPISRMRGLARLEFGIAGGYLAFRHLPIEQAQMLRDQIMNLVTPVDFSMLRAK
jgi:putative membrane protein